MDKKQKKEIINQVNVDLEWLESRYKVIDLPDWEKAHILDLGPKGKDVLIFAPVVPPFEVIHVPNIKYFQDKFRVVVYRRKESNNGPITPVERAEEIVVLMNHLNIKEAHFCGLNEGAIAVFNLSKLDRSKVKSIVCTSIGIDNLFSKFQLKLGKYFPIDPGGWAIGQIIKTFISSAVDSFLVAYLWSLAVNAKNIMQNGVIPLYENYNPHIESLKMPVLNIQSSPIVKYKSAKAFIDSLAKGELRYIPGNSHLCMYIYPDIFNLFMDNFYKSHQFYK